MICDLAIFPVMDVMGKRPPKKLRENIQISLWLKIYQKGRKIRLYTLLHTLIVLSFHSSNLVYKMRHFLNDFHPL